MFNAVIQRFKEAQLQAFESYLMVARYEKEVFPVLEPSLRATRVKKEAELTCEFESFCMRIALAVVETVRSNVPAVVASGIDVASEIRVAESEIKASLALGTVPDMDAFWTSLSLRFNVPVGALQ
ncbi:hypothetical protein GO285_01393 [Ralstonia solanacearum]|nr:hypothetical protein [Ralstonia solanacearum]NKG09597.1 hypothetical protein [Ralstonia solanacearum]